MSCFKPLTAWRSVDKHASGKRVITFSRSGSLTGVSMALPCRQCVGCRIDRASEWAGRCMDEMRMYPHSDHAFITLTYDDDHVPPDGGLVKRDLQLFMKRLRKVKGNGVRFYAVGEYGGQFGRPHYHVLLFNAGFSDDARFLRAGKRPDDALYTSKALSELWKFGFSTFGDVTYSSCRYVAGYVIDKMTGKKAEDWYQGRQPEFSLMSKGIGGEFYRKYAHQIYAHDSVIVDGRERRPPRYYDDKWKMLDSMGLDELKAKRRRVARRFRFHVDNSVDRRRIREIVELKRLKLRGGIL